MSEELPTVAWTPIRFPGQYHDSETDLFENWNRFYDPTVGRYLSPDPILLSPGSVVSAAAGGMSTPVYAYASNNPVNFIDPMGLETGIFVDGLPSGGPWGFFSGIGDAVAAASADGTLTMGILNGHASATLTPAFDGTTAELVAAGMKALLSDPNLRLILVEIAGVIYSEGALQYAVGVLLTDSRSASYMLDLIEAGAPPMIAKNWHPTGLGGGKLRRNQDGTPKEFEVYRFGASFAPKTMSKDGPSIYLPFVSRVAHELGHGASPAIESISHERSIIFETVLQEAFGLDTRTVHPVH